MTAPTLTYSHDGCLQTPCRPWCWHGCDGTFHGSDAVDISVQCHPLPMMVNVCQRADEAEPRVSLVDALGAREDLLTASEAEYLANLLLDHVKIIRANAEEATR